MGREDIIESFLDGAMKGKASSLSINGNILYSYSIGIARREGDDIYVNNRKYSSTTTTQQNAVKRIARARALNVHEVSPDEI